MNLKDKIFAPKIITREEKRVELERIEKEWKEKLGRKEQNLLAILEKTMGELGKSKNRNTLFILLAVALFGSTVLMSLIQIPVPPGKGIWAWYGVCAMLFTYIVYMYLMDGPFIKQFRGAKRRGKTMLLIQRGDGKWGWIIDDLRGRALNSEIYGEYAVLPGSLAMVDGVPVGIADESEGISLPLKLARIAQDLQVDEEIINFGTLESIVNADEKIKEYEEIKDGLEKNNVNIMGDSPDGKYTDQQLEEHARNQILIKNYSDVITYLEKLKDDNKELIELNKRTLVLKPLLDFLPTLANNPIFKRTSRERAIAIEKAKAGKGENMGKIVVYLGGLMLCAGLTVYLIKTGQVDSVTAAIKSGVQSAPSPQGVN